MEQDPIARHHNFLTDCAERIRDRYAKVQGATRQTLEDLKDVGETLLEVKETLKDAGKGAFGRWCEEARLPFDKAWRARLMKLAAHWDEIIAAVEALPEEQRRWSVDGVLAIWKAAKKVEHGETNAEDGEGAGDGANAGSAARKKKETEAERLRRQLAEALAEVERLKAENERLRRLAEEAAGGAASGQTEKKRKVRLSEKGVNLARKLWALHSDPAASEGERVTSKQKLEAMASRLGVSFEELIAAL